MFGMFGIPGFGMTKKMRDEQHAREEKEKEERLLEAVPWDPKIKWTPRMTIKWNTLPKWSLFDVVPTKHGNPNFEAKPEGKFVLSPSGQFMYCEKQLNRGDKLLTLQGSKRGTVMFDGPATFPVLHERSNWEKNQNGTFRWKEEPWMGVTPMEVMTQRPGTRIAKGHTVIAGLGLGWGLVEVMTKRSVKKVTLVEISQELVDWLLPRVLAHAKLVHGEKLAPLEVVVGDAKTVLWDLAADVALIDIFQGYGSNEFFVHGGGKNFGGKPMNIETVWCWGAAPVGDGGRGWF